MPGKRLLLYLSAMSLLFPSFLIALSGSADPISPMSREFGGGSGMPGDPYLITNVTELQMMETNLTAFFALANDIDASETSTWNDGKGFDPIGSGTIYFMGSLDGRNHTISGLYVNDPESDFVGLFARTDYMSTIANLHLRGLHFKAKNAVGGLVGFNFGTVHNVTVEGDIEGEVYTGGLVGSNSGKISDCSTFGTVTCTGTGYAGGMIGNNYGSAIRCDSYCSVDSPGDFVGGLTGKSAGTVTDSHATGDVIGGTASGGLIGVVQSGWVTRSYATGDVYSEKTDVGGLIGINQGTVTDCYSTGNARANYLVGGLIGTSGGPVYRCYSSGHVTGNFSTGGLVGSGGAHSTCFWDNETSGWTTSSGGTGKNTADMMRSQTFSDAGWDLTDIWSIIPGRTYPYLRSSVVPPKFTLDVLPPVNEDEGYEFDLSERLVLFDYPGIEEGAAFSKVSGPDWIRIGGDGMITGIATNEDVGTHRLTIGASDLEGNSAEIDLVIEVLNVNDPPVLTSVPDGIATEDLPYSYVPVAVDIDPTGDEISVRMETDASWLEFNGTGISGVPTNDDVGNFWVNLSASDGNGGSDFQNFTLVVSNVNDPPVLEFEPVKDATEDIEVTMVLSATDIDPTEDTLGFEMDTDATWLVLNGTVISGIPLNDDVGIFTINVSVNDGNGGIDFENFTITVTNVNDPPEILSEFPQSVLQDQEYSVDLTALEVDAGDEVTWELWTDAAWLEMDGFVLNGIPDNDDVGRYQVRITARDENGGSDMIEFVLDVIDVNDPPYWVVAPENVTIKEGEELVIESLAQDIDPGDTVTYSIVTTPSSAITVMSVSGLVRYQDPEPGEYLVELRATDGESTIVHFFTVTVEAEEEVTDLSGLGIVFALCVSVAIIMVLLMVIIGLLIKRSSKGKVLEE